MTEKAHKAIRAFFMTFGVTMNLLLLDVFSKEWAIQALPRSGNGVGIPKPVIPGFFNLTYVENRGAAWGIFQGRVSLLAVFAVLAFACVVWKRKSLFPAGFWGRAAEMMLYAGIIGNLLDRIFRSAVIDFFDFHWGIHHFPCFNFADIYISLAAFLLVVFSFYPAKPAGTDSK